MATAVKLCGITTLEDALAACEAGADAIGFNFAEAAKKRGRHITPVDAKRIAEKLPPYITTVAVCVNPLPVDVADWLTFCDCVQFHGEEAAAFVRPYAQRAVKAFRAGADFEPGSMEAYATRAWLLDASVPGEHGGTGQQADWDLAARAVRLSRPVILAGGLTPENVGEAVRAVRPYAVDTASGIESAPGRKDHARIRDFVRNAKNALSG